jgi:hypothetical protein
MIDNTIYAWEFVSDELYNYIKMKKLKHINFFYMHECEINLSKHVVDYINKNSITVTVILCIKDKKWLHNNVSKLGINKDLITKVITWPTFWFLKAAHELEQNNAFFNNIKKHKFDFKNPFLTFNGRTRPQRTLWIDELAKNNYIKEGIVSYQQIPQDEKQENWKYYTGEILLSGDGFENHFSSYHFNQTFLESFLHIPTETTVDTFLLSEKTANPILCGLPTLTLGSQHYHKNLQDMGFKLYDEIFDYSFDDEADIEQRIQKLMTNVTEVINQKDNLNDLYKKIKDKLDYNRKLALDITKTDEHVPILVKKFVNTKLRNQTHLSGYNRELIELFSKFKTYNIDTQKYKDKVFELEADLWHNFSYDELIQSIEHGNPELVTIYGENEWDPWVTQEFVNTVNLRNIKVTWITGSPESKYLSDRVNNFGIKNFKLKHYPTFWFNHTLSILKQQDISNLQNQKTFLYPFVCFNNRGHLHRCHAIDYISKYNLFDKGVVTWHNFLKENTNFKFKYFDNTVKKIDDEFDVKLDSFLLPHQYHESLFDFVTECSHETIMISEKTITPIILKKPFVTLSAPYFNKYLQELGFVLYDEIIDYSFDVIEDLDTRAHKFVKNMEKISNIRNFDEVYNLLKPKIEFNYQNFLKIIDDRSFIPSEIKNCITKIEPAPLTDHGRLNKYFCILNTNI